MARMEPREDNCRLRLIWLDEVTKIVGWKPFVSAFNDALGVNSHTEFYYSAEEDAYQQGEMLAGMDIEANPQFHEGQPL